MKRFQKNLLRQLWIVLLAMSCGQILSAQTTGDTSAVQNVVNQIQGETTDTKITTSRTTETETTSSSTLNWAELPGIQARDIAVGKNGAIWAIGTGYEIYRYAGSSWERMPGGAACIAVAPDGSAWVTNQGNQIWFYDVAKKSWSIKPGAAKDVGVGADGSVWVVGMPAAQGGSETYKWLGAGWQAMNKGAERIAVDAAGHAWMVNSAGEVWQYNGSSYDLISGVKAKDIGVGADGSVWVTADGDAIYKREGSKWALKTGKAQQIAVGPDGKVYVVNAQGQVFVTTETESTTPPVEGPTTFEKY